MFARKASTEATSMFHYRLLGSKSSKGSGTISNGNESKQHFSNTTRQTAFLDRTQLHNAKRVVIKMGSAVITRDDGMVMIKKIKTQITE